MRKWKIFYGDGSSFSDEDGPPERAPCRNVQAIVQQDDRLGRAICRSDDFYIYHEPIGGWQGVDKAGLFDYLFEPGLKIVKFGRTISNQDWNDILIRACDDDYLPPKTAWCKKERRPA